MINTDNQSNNIMLVILCLNFIQSNNNYTHSPHQPKKLCSILVTLQSNSTETDYKLTLNIGVGTWNQCTSDYLYITIQVIKKQLP